MIKIKNNERKIKNNDKVTPNREELTKSIIFKNVSFVYKSNSECGFKINNLNLVFKSKKLNTLIGESGCGKSTIISILQKLYPSYKGDVFIGDINISLIDLLFSTEKSQAVYDFGRQRNVKFEVLRYGY